MNTSAVMNTTARSDSALLKTLGLPADRLSASIVSFAKFFSLPLEPGLLAKVRQQTGLPGQSTSGRELLSLAALAAADKGLELNEEALAEYASAIDPDQGGRQNAEGRKRGQHNNKKPDDKKTDKQPFSELSPPQLKELALESAGSAPLLDILNRLPGRNGQRWLVFPFRFSENGIEYQVSLKILLGGETAQRMSLDIVQSGKTNGHSLFVLDSTGGKQWLHVYLQPVCPLKARQKLVRELSRQLGLPRERVVVHGDFPAAPDSRDESVCPVDEAV